MVEFLRSDLEFILDQIVIAEAHARGEPLDAIVADPALSFGLRTVDGTHNNLVPGQDDFGAADRIFPRMLDPVLRDAEDMPDLDGSGPMQSGPTAYAQTTGFVADSQPRTISNLVVDQTAGNPAAVEAGGAVVPGDDSGTLFIPNATPDAGLSAPFNSWFTLFGQFFDHGLDLVNKGGSGTIFIPLKPDDPLYDADGPDNIPGSGDEANFMVLTRATNQPGPDGVPGTADDVHEHTNKTTPLVDQNQTYTSHPSHQVFLREYALDADGKPVATGGMLTGADGGLATWADVKAQARDLLGIDLVDADATDLPLLATDPYGRFIRGENGFAQIVTESGLVEGNPAAPVGAATAIRTGHAFLDDIARDAVPTGRTADLDDAVGLTGDGGTEVITGGGIVIGNPGAGGGTGDPAFYYDDELLDAHFATGDGRGNENIGLTAVHHVFHAEHNRLVEHIKQVVLGTGDAAFIAQWRLPDGSWNGERLFQAARFGTEMQYQHLVFEEFARAVQPDVDEFAAVRTDLDPAIVAEFAHTVYRFGHSMLTGTMARTGPDGASVDIGLVEAFLNPLEFTRQGTLTSEQAAGAIVRGMTRQVGNEIDEFVTEALRNNLLGLPLDLATINIARGRDTGIPSLNEARRQFFEGTGGDPALKPYESWAEFGPAIKHPASLVNFIAAYGTHETIASAATLEAKRAAAALLVLGGDGAPDDRLDFLNGTGDWASAADGVTTTGLDAVDFWIGGLAEKQMPSGGLLGSTFNFVFETQLEALQSGDRFYYLARTAGLNFFVQLEESSFAELVMRNTDATRLPFNVFATPDFTIEIGDPATWPEDLVLYEPGDIRFTGDQHVVLGGTGRAERMAAGGGNDALWGDGGDDALEGGAGDDALVGGDGNDTLTDASGEDVIKGGDGDDRINPGLGPDLILGGAGHDYIADGEDAKEVFGGQGNDIAATGDAADEVHGNEGDDWLEGAGADDLLVGDNKHPFALGTVIGHDVLAGGPGTDRMEGENGDDIFVGGEGPDEHIGGPGFDWMTYGHEASGITADLGAGGEPPPALPSDGIREVEGLSGSAFDDVLRGDDEAATSPTDTGLVAGLSALLQDAAFFAGGNIILGGAGGDLVEGRGGGDVLHGDAYLHVALTTRAPGGGIIREIVAPADDDDDSEDGDDGGDDGGDGGGDDTLHGGDGEDELHGGCGDDVFRYGAASEGGDRIADFGPGDDRIEVSASGFGHGLNAASGLQAGQFVGNATGLSDAAAGSGQFVYQTTNGALWWDADGKTGDAAVLVATLAGKPDLSAADMELIA